MLPNTSHQLIQMTNDIENFSFGSLFYNRFDEEERLRRADKKKEINVIMV